MIKVTLFQKLLLLVLTLNSYSSATWATNKKKGNLENDVLLKTPRKKNTATKKKNSLEKASFTSKNKHLNSLNKAYLKTKNGKIIKTYLAISPNNQQQGLSGVRLPEFSKSEGMLFLNKTIEKRSFWMPDTYFNLDIYFLDKNLKVLNIERNIPHHPGRQNLSKVYTTGHYSCQHILELKHSKLSKEIVIGETLSWSSLPQISHYIK